MRIGIDISQLAYPKTGVAIYLENLVKNLIATDKSNEYVLFFSSMRGSLAPHILSFQNNPKITLANYKFPPAFLDFVWNKLHILPIETLVGPIDIFITSDWTEPPTKRAKKATIIYDLIVYKFPNETAKKIVDVQKRKLKWVRKESDLILTISESSKKDVEKILGFPSSSVKVVYPGL